MPKQTINIALSSDNNGVEMMLVAIFSIMKNHSPKEFNIHAFIIQSGFSEENLQKITQLEKSFSNLKINHLMVDKNKLSKLKLPSSQSWISQQAYYRYLLPNLLKEESKILYLDIDILCRGKLGQLYNTDISKHYIAAVPDSYIERGYGRWKGFKKAVGLREDETYVNSGLLLMNLEKIRKDGKVQKFLYNAGENRANLLSEEYDYFVDQTIANITFKDSIKTLSSKWNTMVHDYQHIEEDPRLLHFAGMHKPFTYRDTHPTVIRYMDDYLDIYIECMASVNRRNGKENNLMLKKRLKDVYHQARVTGEFETLNHSLARTIDDIQSSRSWKLTGPLRKLGRRIKRRS